MKTAKRTILVLLLALAGFSVQAETVLSAEAAGSDGSGCLVIFSGQGYRTGWTQSDTYNAVSVSAKLSSNGALNQTGRAYITTQIGPGTLLSHQVAFTGFTFPQEVTSVLLFEGLNLPPGSYYFSIVGDSPGWGSCWAASATNVFTQTGVLSLGGFGAVGVPLDFFPATPFFSELTIPPEFSIQGINVSRPILQIARNGAAVSISWSTSAVGFNLETVNSLSSTNWQVISQGLTINSGRFVFTTNAIGGGRFFRLRKPAN